MFLAMHCKLFTEAETKAEIGAPAAPHTLQSHTQVQNEETEVAFIAKAHWMLDAVPRCEAGKACLQATIWQLQLLAIEP